MRARRQTFASSSRSLAVCVLALFALGWLLDRAHGALEPHHYCAEHGRVEHAGGAVAQHDSTRHDSTRHDSTRHDSTPDGPALEGRSEAGHETCCVPLARSEEPLALVHPPLDAFAWVPARGVVVDLVEHARARSAVPLVFLAPKQSPPRG